ncbi:MAG: translation initiation factor IF-3 [Chlamydiota bacterium]
MKVNRKIRAREVRLIGKDGEQIGIVSIHEALELAERDSLDLVEISPNANPPVCKIIDYGKYRYQLTKKERESKKAQHQVKVKEIRFKPNIDSHDLETKLRRARDFLSKGNKVRFTCTFRGRGIAHPELGENLINQAIECLSDIAQIEIKPKLIGRNLSLVLAPLGQQKRQQKKGDESA